MIIFPNTVKGNCGIRDMNYIMHKGIRYEWICFLNVFNDEIILSSVTNKVGSSLQYCHCLEYLKEQNSPVTLHTEQGSVCLSMGFYKTHKDYANIKQRSMSKVGTSTENPIIESLNGWIKEEMRTDFNL